MRLVPISCIKENTLLAKTIYDIDGRTLLKRGVPLNQKLILKIRKYGIKSLYIDDDYSHIEIKEIIKPEIKRRALKAIKSTFDTLKKQREHFDKNGTDNVSLLAKIAKDIVNDLLSQNQIFVNMVDIKTMDNYTYEHSLSVAILSLILGVEVGLGRDELCDLCIGAMLHDVGKIFVPLEILNKPSTLTQHEYEIIRNHTVCGYDYLYNDNAVKSSSRLIALQHHEACDGTGYPNGLFPPQIHKFSKIVAIADIYDAMTSDRPYRPGIQ
ncbi:MAG: HD family phosphohydrolase, partial [Clostridiales bacterium]